MQPFSPFLFALGNPTGPERLVRMLAGEITEKDAIREWAEGKDDKMETTNLMGKKHICVCCYLKGKSLRKKRQSGGGFGGGCGCCEGECGFILLWEGGGGGGGGLSYPV